MPLRRLVVASVAALALLLAAARADDEAQRDAVCPLDGHHFAARLVVSSNEGGGRDSDGCRWAVDRSGRLEVLELREIVACPRCGAALYRGHVEAAARLRRHADEASIVSALAAAGPLDPLRLETTVARAIATYRVLGLAPLGVREDQDAFEGQLWLRAAWAVRMRLVREDDQPQALPIVFAPRSTQDAHLRLEALQLQATPTEGPARTPVEDALGTLDHARGVLDPLDAETEPSRRFAFERVRGALDVVEQTLLVLRAFHNTDRDAAATSDAARQFALAVARAAHRAGEGLRRDTWLADATNAGVRPETADEASRLRTWVQQEDRYLALAAASLARAGERASGERRSALLALAADATRRRVVDPDSELVGQARDLARRAQEGSGPGSQLAAFVLERLGDR